VSALDAVQLRRRALPELDLAAVSLRARLFDRWIDAPVLGDTPVIARVGAPDVRGRDGLWRAAELVEQTEADALHIRNDPLQEARMAGGRTDFSGVAEGIAAIVAHVSPVPVIATAIDFEDVVLLREAGVAAIEVDGREVPLDAALTDARAAAPGVPLIAFGGIRHGADVAKCLALGATACTLDDPAHMASIVEQLRIATWLCGAGSVHELGREHLR
jgi:isopentenyl-diphosphate delta-isomerase